MVRIFVDMDGTIAKWCPDGADRLYDEHYFSSLPVMQQMTQAVNRLVEISPQYDLKVYSLSAVLKDSPYAEKEKNMWLDRHTIIKNRIFVPNGADKTEYVPRGIKKYDFLLDDYSKNLHEWRVKENAIKLLNGINNTKHTWKGNKISSRNSPEQIVERILSICLCGQTVTEEY